MIYKIPFFLYIFKCVDRNLEIIFEVKLPTLKHEVGLVQGLGTGHIGNFLCLFPKQKKIPTYTLAVLAFT